MTNPSRRSVVAGVACSTLVLPAFDADSDPQPAAFASHFPQMPTGFVGVTPCGTLGRPQTIPRFGRIASITEPGEPLEVTGTVYKPGGNEPAEGIVLFAYHTDIRGHYNEPNSPFNPRIHGWAKTGKDGRYGFRTIKPAPYPENTSPAHIHVTLTGPDNPEYWVDAYWFEGDPRIIPHQRSILTGRGGGGETLRLTKGADGVLRGSRDFVLEHVAVAGGCRLL